MSFDLFDPVNVPNPDTDLFVTEDDELNFDNPSVRVDAVQEYLNAIGRIPLLTPAQELAVAREVAAGDTEAKKKMFEANLRLVVSVTTKCLRAANFSRFGVFGLLDFINEGNIGLMEAVDRFDPERGFRLSTFAVPWIKGAITRALSNKARTIRLPVGLVDGPTVTRSLDAAVFDMTGENIGTLGDLDEDREYPVVAERRVAEGFAVDVVQPCLAALSPRDQFVLVARYGLAGVHATNAEIGGRLEITGERVRQLAQGAVVRLTGVYRIGPPRVQRKQRPMNESSLVPVGPRVYVCNGCGERRRTQLIPGPCYQCGDRLVAEGVPRGTHLYVCKGCDQQTIANKCPSVCICGTRDFRRFTLLEPVAMPWGRHWTLRGSALSFGYASKLDQVKLSELERRGVQARHTAAMELIEVHPGAIDEGWALLLGVVDPSEQVRIDGKTVAVREATEIHGMVRKADYASRAKKPGGLRRAA